MYMAYGWPQVIPLLSGLCPSTQRIVYLKVLNRLLLIVSPSHIELWSSSQYKVRLGKYRRDSDSLEKDGENLQAVWSPDGKLIAVITSSLYLYIFKVQFTEKRIQIGGKQPSGLSLATISLLLCEQVPFANKNLSVSNIVCDSKHMLIGLSDGSIYLISWKGEFCGTFEINNDPYDVNKAIEVPHYQNNGVASGGDTEYSTSNHNSHGRSAIIQMELSMPLKLLAVLFSDGQLKLCSVSKRGLKLAESIRAEKNLGSGDAVCASVASDQQILAVGTRSGTVQLYDLTESVSLIRTVSLCDWGYSMEDTGPVSCISWTPDNSAFAVGWKLRGITVWSVSGCRLMSTIRQVGLSISSPVVKPNQDSKYEPLMGGTSIMHWDEYGYRLYAIEEGSSERMLAFSFGKCCLNRGVSGTTYVRQVIYGEDRLLIVQREDTHELKIVHVNLPVSYISQNWPVLHVAASKDGMYLAVAGLHGIIIYDIQLKKWRMFGDITQEQKIQCKGLSWLGKIVVVCNYIDSSNTYELLFYPRYHLDQSSLMCQKVLLTKPIVMDVYQDYILVTYRPFDVHIFYVKISGDLTPSSSPDLQLSTVRELSIMTAKSHPAAMRFIPDQLPREHITKNPISSKLNLPGREPARCLILRANGEISLLDLDDGRERELTDSVEIFWVTCGQSDEETNLIEEVSWLDYGSRGMQVWYPSPGVDPFKQEDFMQLDPELEFDREVYPLGLIPNAGVVVGVSQRMSFSACTEFPCFEPSPQAQTILHCLLRHLLQRNKMEEALRLAHLSAEKPHFSHCMEWLLFTVFDAEISRQNTSKNKIVVPKHPTTFTLLEKTCDLIRNFPEYHDVVVSVARKTDGRHWADLFSAAGRSTELFEECFQRRWYRTAACYILVIAKLDGPAVSQYCALRLLQATLDESLYELAGELVRFLLRSGRDEHASTDSDKLSPKFLGYLLFPSNYKKQSVDSKSSFKEQSAHIASVKNILESHASYLMSGKELSKLVAFVKGTQFDLVEYLQRERKGCARLENFASGLELIGQKLQMDTLQSRLDADFLLAHMCSVQFKEWIVVLATLLRRSEVLVDLFRHDMRLWQVYSMTLQSQPAFAEYQDLVEALEEKLTAVSGADVPAASGVNGDGGTVGSVWVDKIKDGWQSVVDAVTVTGDKAKEVSSGLTPYYQQMLDANPYLKDVVGPIGYTLTGTALAWFVMPWVLRRLHKYAMLSPTAALVGDVPYEKSFWGALEDPVRYLVTFMAFTQIGAMVAPTTIAVDFLPPAWRGAAIASLVWFLYRLKTNFLALTMTSQSLAGPNRETLLTLDKIASIGLFAIGIMALAEACGVAVQSILTVGGIGGVATAFAAKDILGNVLSGWSMQFAKPFSLGDTIKAGSIEGQVVQMGFTTTSLLNAEKFPVIVPNSYFSSQVIVNKSRAQWRAFVTKIPIQNKALDKIPAISEAIKTMLKSNTKIFLDKDLPYCFLSRIDSSVAELTLGCNLKHMAKSELYNTQQEILLQAVQIVKNHGGSLGDITEQDAA